MHDCSGGGSFTAAAPGNPSELLDYDTLERNGRGEEKGVQRGEIQPFASDFTHRNQDKRFVLGGTLYHRRTDGSAFVLLLTTVHDEHLGVDKRS